MRASREFLLTTPDIELTRIVKDRGLCTKSIFLKDGKPESDSTQCQIAQGTMERLVLSDWRDFAREIEKTPRNVAYALGALRPGLPDRMPLVSRRDPRSKEPGFVTRTQGNIVYVEGLPAAALIDHDRKGMTLEVAGRLKEHGGFTKTLEHLCPGFRHAGIIERSSTSAGLYNQETGEEYPSGGVHIDLLVRDGSDIKRFLYTLHDRAWLADLGWYIVGAAGQLLERSVVDRSVCDPARLVFEADPDLTPPLAQHERKAIVRDGSPYDTRAMPDDLNHVELQKLKKLKADAAAALGMECKAARETWMATHIRKSTERGMTREAAQRIMDRLIDNRILHPSIILQFDDLGEISVADILVNPSKYEGETLADPIDGISYGTCKAKVYLFKGGTVKIHSCAHGLDVWYLLRHDVASIEAAIEAAPKSEAVAILCRMIPQAEINAIEESHLIELAASRTGTKQADVRKMLKDVKGKDKPKDGEDGDCLAEIAAINKDHALVVENGKTLIFHEVWDPVLNRMRYARMTPNDFRTAYGM